MTFKVLPQEFHRLETMNNMVVRTKVPKSEFNDQATILLDRLRGLGNAAGDHILVQILSESGEELLHEADFVILSAKVTRELVQDDQNERTVTKTVYRLVRKSNWLDWPVAGAAQAAPPPSVPPATAKARAA